jgi:hypothetical protein
LRESTILFISVSEIGTILILWNLQGNESFTKGIETLSPLAVNLNFQQSKKKKKETIENTVTFSGCFIFSSFIRREDICSVTCTFPVSYFIIFYAVFILADLAINLL